MARWYPRSASDTAWLSDTCDWLRWPHLPPGPSWGCELESWWPRTGAAPRGSSPPEEGIGKKKLWKFQTKLLLATNIPKQFIIFHVTQQSERMMGNSKCYELLAYVCSPLVGKSGKDGYDLKIADRWSTRITSNLTAKIWMIRVNLTWKWNATYRPFMGCICATYEYNPWNRHATGHKADPRERD